VNNKNDGFSFKQFHVAHALCAMKVGTDGILLGAWADLGKPVSGPLKVLDIGTGSGLISLMLAQRCNGQLQATAIDIDAEACRQAEANVQASPWPAAIQIAHISLQDLQLSLSMSSIAKPLIATPLMATSSISPQDSHTDGFDLIVSNPPYFVHGQMFESDSRQTARHTASLSHQELIDCALPLLSRTGSIALVLPYAAGCELIAYCQRLGGLSMECVNIKTTPNKPYKRMLLKINHGEQVVQSKELIIHADGGEYSNDYTELTRDFYLSM
jgi:tRNA1Val (adenine37-N6)-methyltransferase